MRKMGKRRDPLIRLISEIAGDESTYRRYRYHLPAIGDPTRVHLDENMNKLLKDLEALVNKKPRITT